MKRLLSVLIILIGLMNITCPVFAESTGLKKENIYLVSNEQTIKYGYIDKTGKIVIEPKFNSARSFHEGLAAVQVDSKWGFIDKTGNIVIKPRFSRAYGFFEGLSGVEISDKNNKTEYFCINKMGKVVAKSEFSEGLAVVKVGEKYGYIDKTNKLAIKPQFDWALPFHEGVAGVQVGNKLGMIDKTGRIIVEPRFDMIHGIWNGVVLVNDFLRGKGYITTTGKIIAEPQFDNAFGFSEGLARVKVGKNWDFIDKTGKMVIEHKYHRAKDFSEGLSAVSGEKLGWFKRKYGTSKWVFIDKTGKLIIDFKFDKASYFSEGFCAVGVSNR